MLKGKNVWFAKYWLKMHETYVGLWQTRVSYPLIMQHVTLSQMGEWNAWIEANCVVWGYSFTWIRQQMDSYRLIIFVFLKLE